VLRRQPHRESRPICEEERWGHSQRVTSLRLSYAEQAKLQRTAGNRHQGYRPYPARSPKGGKVGSVRGAGGGKTVNMMELIRNIAHRSTDGYRILPVWVSGLVKVTTSITR